MRRTARAICLFWIGAQAAHAAPGPTTRVVETPESGLRAYNYFMQKVDEAGMIRRVYAPTPGLIEVAKAFTYSDGQIAAACHAAQKKFGGSAGKELGRAFHDVSDDDMAGGTVAIDPSGTRGIFVTTADQSIPMALDGGVWKIDARTFAPSGDESSLAIQVTLNKSRGDFAKALAASIDAGDLPTIDEVVARVGARAER